MDIELRGELMPIELPWQLRRFDRIHFEISNGSDLELQAVGSFPTGPKIRESENSSLCLYFGNPIYVMNRKAFGDDEIDEYHQFTSISESFGHEDDANAEISRLWYESGVCPDPFLYRVTNSSLLKTLQIEDYGYAHYSLHTDDSFLTVVATAFRWERA